MLDRLRDFDFATALARIAVVVLAFVAWIYVEHSVARDVSLERRALEFRALELTTRGLGWFAARMRGYYSGRKAHQCL